MPKQNDVFFTAEHLQEENLTGTVTVGHNPTGNRAGAVAMLGRSGHLTAAPAPAGRPAALRSKALLSMISHFAQRRPSIRFMDETVQAFESSRDHIHL